MTLLHSALRTTLIFQLVFACCLFDVANSAGQSCTSGCGVTRVCESGQCKLKNSSDCTSHEHECVAGATCNTGTKTCVCASPLAAASNGTCLASSPGQECAPGNTCNRNTNLVCESNICKLKNGADCTAHDQDCVARARCLGTTSKTCNCTNPGDQGDTCAAATQVPQNTATTNAPQNTALFGEHCQHVEGSPIGNCTANAECSMGMCVCVMGFHDTARKTCMMAAGQRHCLQNGCVDNADCTPVPTSPAINECQCKLDYYATDNGTCEARISLGKSCEPLDSGRSPCVQPAATACHNNLCVCNEDYRTSIQCLPRVTVDTHCSSNDVCVKNAHCGDSNLCKCNDTYYEDHTHHCQKQIAPGHPCNVNLEAHDQCMTGALCNPNGVCECVDHQYRYIGDSCQEISHLGGSCSTSADCIDNAECTGNKCVCPNDRFYNHTLSNCQLRKPPGSACNASEECAENANCIEERCLCEIEYYENNQQCYPRQHLGHECQSSIPNQCLINGECVNELCQCNDKSYNNEGVSCPITLGFNETCNWENPDPRQCISNTTCIFRPFDSLPACGCDIDHFFNGLYCVKRALAGEPCPYYSANSYGLHMPIEEFHQQCVENALCNDRRICECETDYYDKAGHCPHRIAVSHICDPWRDYPYQCVGTSRCLYGRCV